MTLIGVLFLEKKNSTEEQCQMNLEQSPLAEAAFYLFINVFILSPSVIFTLKGVQKLYIIKTNLAAASYPTNFFFILPD